MSIGGDYPQQRGGPGFFAVGWGALLLADRQAHMADLQAGAAAAHLLAEINGQTPSAAFKVEQVCIIDTIDHATLVFSNEKRQINLPFSRLFQGAKRWFENTYLKKYR